MGGFDPPPLTLRSPVRSHYATMTRLICAPKRKRLFSIAHIRHSLHCVHLPIYHRVVSINRPSGYEPDALPLRHDDGLSFGGFDPPPLDSLVCDHYTTNGWFRSTSSNTASMRPHTATTCLICAPFIFCKIFPSHISVTAFAVSIFPFFQTFGKYIVFQTDNFLQPVIKIIFDMCPAVAHICHRLHYVQINHINNFFIINSINRLNDFKISLLRYVPHPRTYPSLITFVALPKCHWVVSIHLPDAEVISALPLLV